MVQIFRGVIISTVYLRYFYTGYVDQFDLAGPPLSLFSLYTQIKSLNRIICKLISLATRAWSMEISTPDIEQ